MTYQDVLNCSTYERRFFLQLLMNENTKKMEAQEENMNKRSNSVSGKGNKGSRTTRIGGDQLKQKLLSGEIPNE